MVQISCVIPAIFSRRCLSWRTVLHEIFEVFWQFFEIQNIGKSTFSTCRNNLDNARNLKDNRKYEYTCCPCKYAMKTFGTLYCLVQSTMRSENHLKSKYAFTKPGNHCFLCKISISQGNYWKTVCNSKLRNDKLCEHNHDCRDRDDELKLLLWNRSVCAWSMASKRPGEGDGDQEWKKPKRKLAVTFDVSTVTEIL